MTLSYSDIDPNVIELLARQLESPLEKLIEDKIQRRQQWGPTFKQEDIAELSMTDADFIVPAPEYGKRVFRMAGTLSVQRVLRVPPIPSAWWIIHNRTSQSLHILTDPTGVVGPVIPPDQVGAVYTDGVGVWQFACCGGETIPGGEEMPPGGTGTEIQYRLNATTFGGVGSSFTSGANVTWGGTQTMNKMGDNSHSLFIDPAVSGSVVFISAVQYQNTVNPIVWDFQRGRGTFLSPSELDPLGGDGVAIIQFRGAVGTPTPVLTTFGTIESGLEADGGWIAIGHSQGSFYASGDGTIGLYQGIPEKSFEIDNTGFKLSHGINNSTFYQDASGYFVPVPAGTAGQVLSLVGGVPGWASVAGASFPALNQVTDPTADKNFNMTTRRLVFTHTGVDQDGQFVIETIPSVDTLVPGALVRISVHGTNSLKVPFLVTANGNTSIATQTNGAVGIRSEGDPAFALVVDTRPAQIRQGLYVQRSAAILTEQTFNVLATLTGTAGQSELWYPSSIDLTDSSTAGVLLPRRTAFFVRYRRNTTDGGEDRSVAVFQGFSNAGTLSGRLVGATFTADIAGSLNTWCGVYIEAASGLGFITNNYGLCVDGGTFNGFGTITPLAMLHVVGTTRFDLGSDALGDIYYRSATSGPLVALHNSGSAWDGRVLTLSSGIPVWATATGGPGSTTPGGDPGNLQYNVADTSFEGILGTSVGLDANSIMTVAYGSNQITAGTLDGTSYIALRAASSASTQLLIQAGHGSQLPTLLFRRSDNFLGNISTGQSAGDIRWEARVGGVWVVQGLLKTSYSATLGGTVWLSSGTGGSRVEIFQKTVRVTAIDGSPYWQYEYTSTGPKWTNSTGTHGLQGAIYYVSSTIAQTALPISTTAGQVLTTTEISVGVWEPRWANPSGGPGGGITSTGGNTNAIQYRSGAGTTTLGGVNTAIGVLIASTTNGLASFSTTLPTTRLWFSPGTTAGLNVGQGFSQPSSLNSVDGDIFYDSSLGKFRVRENGQWWDMRGGGTGSVSPPVSLDYTATVNQPTLYVNHSQAGPASTVANVYGEIHWFRHLHSGAVSDGRRGFTFAWDHQSSGTGLSTNGDIIIEVYATNALSMGLSGYNFTGFQVGTFFNSVVGMFTGIRVKSVNATIRRAIVVDVDAGDVVIGGALSPTATHGFLFIPTCSGANPSVTPTNFPAGTCALIYRSDTNQLFANDGAGWNLV